MKLTFKIWRQPRAERKGTFVSYSMDNLHQDMSLFEAMDVLNDELLKKGEDTIEFDHDCREGICGQCGLWINGEAHGPGSHNTSCQVYLRSFANGQEITIEPFRAKNMPIKKDLKIDRSAMDRIIAAGGYISVNTGQAPDANAIPIPSGQAEEALDAASCIGCGACIASCKNASAALFTGAKVSHLVGLPQGKPEAKSRVKKMVQAMDSEGFGACSFTGACEAVCPQEISIVEIVRMNSEYIRTILD
ncbi:MAG: succinate dehydrogenase/fumarate reductase iron-sulfur subunit [Cyclobacteriaceae bacterium]